MRKSTGNPIFLYLSIVWSVIAFAEVVFASPPVEADPASSYPALPHPADNPQSPLMLAGDWVPKDIHTIDFAKLPRVPSQHAIVSDRCDEGVEKAVNQHNYLAHYDGRYWVMWSDGPGREDRVGQRVKFANSDDGLVWTRPKYLTPEPPGSGPGTKYYATRTAKGFRWISRGFWQREGELLALAALDEAGKFFGPSLELRAFRWNGKAAAWDDAGVVFDNAINNFPPKRLPTGTWMMSRRTHDYRETVVHFLVGGDKTLDQWESFPVLSSNDGLAAEEPYWWVLPDKNLVAFFRDNQRSGYLYRSFSTDNGRRWSQPMRTNFPDARSKFNGLRMSDGRYVLVSNANPRQRDPLVLSISDDGLIFTKMFYLVGGRHVDYPHVIEQDGHLLIAFATEKLTVEVLKVRVADLNRLRNERARGE